MNSVTVRDTSEPLYAVVIEYFALLVLILHGLGHIDRVLHLLLRFLLPSHVHTKSYEALSSQSSILNYPMVAVQLPMMNEIECCLKVIECVCNFVWPKSRLVIQVLDDSTDAVMKELIDQCVDHWRTNGFQIGVHRRESRIGFKAGGLQNGMSVLENVDYIALFDVDFQPTPDYLMKTIPILMNDPKIAFVQARWTFTNAKESFLTKMQEILLNFHHKCEQECRSRASLFFTFNGTAGVWRKSAIEQVGGWHYDTLVEDLDISIRAYILGWKSVYLEYLECLNELPPTLTGYLSQQFRWTSGPIQVGRKVLKLITKSKKNSLFENIYCIWYIIRSATHFITFISIAVILPCSIWVPKWNKYNWLNLLLTLMTSTCHSLFTPDSTMLCIVSVFFLNAISINHSWATVSGILNLSLSKQWDVTPKFGSKKDSDNSPHASRDRFVLGKIMANAKSLRINKLNLVMAVYLCIMTWFAYEKKLYPSAIYMGLTSVMEFLFAFSLIGRAVD